MLYDIIHGFGGHYKCSGERPRTAAAAAAAAVVAPGTTSRHSRGPWAAPLSWMGASNTAPRHSAWQPMQYIQLFIMLLYRIAYICMWNMNHNIFRATALGCYLGMLRLMSCTPAATNTIAIVLIMLCCYCFSNFMDLNNMRKKWNLDADLCWITTHPFSDTLASLITILNNYIRSLNNSNNDRTYQSCKNLPICDMR